MVPPTPGPLAAAALVDSDIGTVILWVSVATLAGSIAGWGYALAVGPRIESPPSAEFASAGVSTENGHGTLPPLGWAYAPIIVPLLLIAGSSVAELALPEGNIVRTAMGYLGWPVVALGIGVVLSYRSSAPEHAEARRSDWIEAALRTSAMIIVVTGLGGALSEILQATPAVDAIADAVAATGLPSIFLPFVLGVVGNLVTGSTTVGVITAASISAPLMGRLDLSPEATMLAGAAGSVIIKYVNSSYFWVATSLSRMPLRSALIAYGGVTLIGGIVSMAVVYALWTAGVI